MSSQRPASHALRCAPARHGTRSARGEVSRFPPRLARESPARRRSRSLGGIPVPRGVHSPSRVFLGRARDVPERPPAGHAPPDGVRHERRARDAGHAPAARGDGRGAPRRARVQAVARDSARARRAPGRRRFRARALRARAAFLGRGRRAPAGRAGRGDGRRRGVPAHGKRRVRAGGGADARAGRGAAPRPARGSRRVRRASARGALRARGGGGGPRARVRGFPDPRPRRAARRDVA